MRKGFTLLEILIVVSLLTIMASVCVVTIGTFTQKHRSQGQQKIISTDLAYVRNLAQIMSVDSNILFYNSTYTIQAAHFSKKIFLQKGYTVATQQLGFTPQGTPKYSRTVILYYQKKPVSKLTIAVGSGLIRWQNL